MQPAFCHYNFNKSKQAQPSTDESKSHKLTLWNVLISIICIVITIMQCSVIDSEKEQIPISISISAI